jgi:hypothetical protein
MNWLPRGKVGMKKAEWYREKYDKTPSKKEELSDRL